MGALKELWRNPHLDMYNKYLLFRAIPMNLLLWGAETWSLRKSQLDKLEVFLHRSIRRILQISMSTVQEQRLRNGKVRDIFYSIPCVRNMIAQRPTRAKYFWFWIQLLAFERTQRRNSLQTHQEVCHVHARRATHRHHLHTPEIISSIPSRRTTHDQLF